MSDIRNKVYEVLRNFGFDEFMSGQITSALQKRDLIGEGRSMTGRNVFENNDPELYQEDFQEDLRAVGDGPHVMLPPLNEGYRYGLTKLPSGRSAVVVEDVKENTELDRAFPETDQFGRHQL